MKCETHLHFQAKSFEIYKPTFVSGGISVVVAIIYRLHPTKKNYLKFVDSLATNGDYLLILDDFKIQWDCQRNADTKQLPDILKPANFRQHGQENTHRRGHILDLVISRDVSSMLTGHFLIYFDVEHHLVHLYNSTLRGILDEHAPLMTKEMPSRPMLPWYNKNIQALDQDQCCE